MFLANTLVMYLKVFSEVRDKWNDISSIYFIIHQSSEIHVSKSNLEWILIELKYIVAIKVYYVSTQSFQKLKYINPQLIEVFLVVK